MLTPEDRQHVLAKLQEIESWMILRGGETVALGALCKARLDEAAGLEQSTDSLAPILRTALVINWRESAMMSRYARFRELFPDVDSLAKLKQLIDKTAPLTFCREYLNINANPQKASENPKYRLLRNLTEGFLTYQQDASMPTEIAAIRDWAKRVDLSKLSSDAIGKYHGVGKGVVENIRLNLGLPVIKPDRHVIGVIRQFLQVKVPTKQYNQLADELGQDLRYIDCLLFEYGKAMRISA